MENIKEQPNYSTTAHQTDAQVRKKIVRHQQDVNRLGQVLALEMGLESKAKSEILYNSAAYLHGVQSGL